MLAEYSVSYTCVVLLRDEEQARLVAAELAACAAPDGRVTVVVPPIRGVDYFVDPKVHTALEAWRAGDTHSSAMPIYLMEHDKQVEDCVEAVDGLYWIVCDESRELDSYRGRGNVKAVLLSGDARELSAGILSTFGRAAGIFSNGGAKGQTLAEPAPPAPPHGMHPFDLLATMTASELATTHAPELPITRAVGRGGRSMGRISLAGRSLRRAGANRNVQPIPDRDLAALLYGRGATIVAVGSRKGGVGKTSHAAGVAIAAGYALDTVGHRAAIVDANIANPDAWGHLNLPIGAATVRDTIAALTANVDPPEPIHASTPALACYPELRETSEYTRTDVQRLAEYLRRRYTFIVVDMSNRLPDPTGGPEASAAAYWLEAADVLVLPAAASKHDFNGVLDYLDLPHLPPTIVAYLVPKSRRTRDHPLTTRYLDAIGRRVHSIVNLPEEADIVRFAGMEGLPVQAVSSSLRTAYRVLAERLATAPPRRDR